MNLLVGINWARSAEFMQPKKKYEKMKISTSLLILALTVISAEIFHDTEAAQERYRFPDHCTCQYAKLRRARHCRNPTCFPDNRDLGLEGDCLPHVPEK